MSRPAPRFRCGTRPDSGHPRLRSMEAFYVVVLAAAVLGVGVVALMAMSRMRKKMDRPDSQER